MVKVLGLEQLGFTVGELKLECLHTLHVDDAIEKAVELMVGQNIGSIGILEQDKLVGIVTEKDFLSKFNLFAIGEEIDASIKLKELMTKKPMVGNHSMPFIKALNTMVSRDFRHLPILFEDGQHYMLSVRDVLDVLCDCFVNELQKYPFVKEWDRTSPTLQEDMILFDDTKVSGISETIFQTPLKRIYKTHVNFFDIHTTINEYLEKTYQSEYYIGYVMEYETTFKGIITERDVLKKVFTKELALNEPIAKLMTPDPDILCIHHQFGNALKNMQKFNYRNMPIANQEGIPIGNITLLDLLSLFSSAIAE